jgi:rhodanese-related sulfurtransferase
MHIKDVKHTPLSMLNDHLSSFPAEQPFYVHCAGGYRSVIAASILKSRGIHNVIDVAGGFKDIKETNITLTDEISCSSTSK